MYIQDDGTYVQGFVDGVMALEPGQISSQPVESEYGWHIIERLPLTEEDYTQLRPDIVYTLTGQTIDDLLNTWMTEADVEYPEGHDDLTIESVLGEEVPDIADLMGDAAASSGAASSSEGAASSEAASSAE